MRSNRMHPLKLLISAILAALLSIGMTALLLAATDYRDVSGNEWFSRYVDFLDERDVVSGYPDNTFRPNQGVTRAEFATMLARSQDLEAEGNVATQFTDVPANHWASAEVRAAADRGWIAGYPDNTFRPDRPISMAEMYAVVSKIAGLPEQTRVGINQTLGQFADGGQVPGWAEETVAAAVKLGIYVSDVTPNRLNPRANASRADVTATLAKLLNPEFRGGVEMGGDRGRPVQVIGRLEQAAAGEWRVITGTGETYYISGPEDFDPAVFGEGRVELFGYVDTGETTDARTYVIVDHFSPVAGEPGNGQGEVITVTGELNPTVEAGGWTLTTRQGHKYLLLDVSTGTRAEDWFTEGSMIEVTGQPEPDTPTIYMEGTPLRVREIEPDGEGR